MEGAVRPMHPWFWGWVVVAVAIALVSALARDRGTLPFALGAAVAAAIEGFGGTAAWEWIAFAGVSCVLFIVMNRRWYRARHAHSPQGRHRAGR